MKEFNFTKSGEISKKYHKYWEVQCTNMFDTGYFKLNINWSRKQDHAGFLFLFEFFDFMLMFQIYDNRHWDYEKNIFQDNNIIEK